MPVTLPSRNDHAVSRRAALAGLAGIGLTAVAARPLRAVEPAPWFALVSDTHIAADRTAVNRGQNMTENLRRTVAAIAAEPSRPAGVIVDGDLALSTGQPGDYETFLSLVEPLRAAGVPVHLTLGNHDDRSHFRAAVKADGQQSPMVEDRHVTVVEGPGVRFIMLDSLEKVNSTPGLLGEAQLDWLVRTLDADPETPTLLVVHHNLAVVPGGLKDTPALVSAALPRRQVKGIIYGHSHRWEHVREPIGFMHLVNLPAVAYSFHDSQPLGWIRFEPTADGARLQLRCVGGDQTRDGQQLDLAWREGPR